MKQEKIINAKKVSCASFIVILTIAIIHVTINAIKLINGPFTSFPWYSAIFFTGIYYIIPLGLSLGIFAYFYNKSSK